MSDFSRRLKKAGIIDRLEDKLEQADRVQMNMMVLLGAYEASYGALEPEFIGAVQELMRGRSFEGPSAFYEAAVAAAKTAIAEREYAAATADLDSRVAEESAIPGESGSQSSAVPDAED